MKALDLFCCAGGAGMGLHRAGYDVVGVDINPQPHYPFPFLQADVMRLNWDGFDLIWASPPCQRYSCLTGTQHRDNHPDLLPLILTRLRGQDTPYIVENVAGAQRYMRNPIMLCGSMFGLRVQRHRWFEIGNTDAFFLTPMCDHSQPPILVSGVTRRLENGKRREHSKAEKTAAIGIDWMILKELDEAIPPAYAEFLARQISRASQGAHHDRLPHRAKHPDTAL